MGCSSQRWGRHLEVASGHATSTNATNANATSVRLYTCKLFLYGACTMFADVQAVYQVYDRRRSVPAE
jgi:hypothetical protein